MILNVRCTNGDYYWAVQDPRTKIVTYGDTKKEAVQRNHRAVSLVEARERRREEKR